MQNNYRNEMICDFAETYQIYDYKSLPARTAAILLTGLRENSRVKMKANEMEKPLDTILQCMIVDRLGYIAAWATGTEVPPSTINAICKIENTGRNKNSDLIVYDSPESFIDSWNEITKGGA